MKKSDIIAMKSIAYWSGCGGLEIKYIEEDKVYFVTGVWVGKPKAHSAKIYTTQKDVQYFRYQGYKVIFNDCIRM